MNFYLTSDAMEPADGQAYYTEQLVRLPNLSFYYEPKEPPAVGVSRAQLGLSNSAIVFWCGQSLYKYLPRYDDVFHELRARSAIANLALSNTTAEAMLRKSSGNACLCRLPNSGWMPPSFACFCRE